MVMLIITVFGIVGISALCSMSEAALYSVSWAQIETMRKQQKPAGERLFTLRNNVDKPIAAILTLNTVANTAGAALAGALAAEVLGANNMALFAGGLTLLILAFGEIVPKTLGVAYAAQIASFMAYGIQWMVVILTPFIWLSGLLTRLVTSKSSDVIATEDDIRAMASLSHQSGGIQAYEEHTIKNILALDQKRVHEVMTPRTIVFSLQEDTNLETAYAMQDIWNYSRIPVYGDNNEDLVGLVMRRDIGKAIKAEQGALTVCDIMRPIRFVLENQTLDKLFMEFLEAKQHLFAVLDEFGGLAGVVSLEDVLEEMLGHEIVDESDAVADLRAEARQRRNDLIAMTKE